MRRFWWIAVALALGSAGVVHAQQPEAGRKQARAIRVTPGAIVLDGRLNEDVWTKAPAITDFIQKDPVEGAPPSDRVEVSFAYNNTAGSTLFVVWQQNRAETDPVGTRASIRDMFNSIMAPGDHVLAVKTTFWISPR